MGEYAPSAPSNTRKEVDVLVTGFDVFLDHNANSSWLIAKSLSSELLPSPSGSTRINVHVRPRPLRVSYQYVREQLPPLLFPTNEDARKPDEGQSELHGVDSILNLRAASQSSSFEANPRNQANEDDTSNKQSPNFDFVVLIGMAAGRRYYTMETRGRRDGYIMPDVDGHRLIGDTYWNSLGAPEILETELDAGDVWRRWKEECMDEDVRPSNDAGRYLCDFSFYTALVEHWRRNSRRPVTFLHVPGETTEEHLKRGKKVAEGLVRAIAESEAGRTERKTCV